jgi:galactose oxidase-like protein/Kelch motif protein
MLARRSLSGVALVPALLLSALVGSQPAASAEAQAVHWTQRSPATSPPSRYGGALTYDAVHHVVVMFGGFSGGGALLNDTWIWNGTNWLQRFPATSPPARHYHFLAYDSTHHRILLFGGLDQTGWRNDTWTWDGMNWTERHPAASPDPRAGNNSLADDPGVGGLVLFGGYDASQSFNDTWEWNGTSWTQVFPATSPTSGSPSLAYSSGDGKVILFGLGQQTWGFTGTNWIERFPATSPPARSFNGMAGARRGVVIFGGSGSPLSLDDTWRFNGTTWTQLSGPGPSARQFISIALDRRSNNIVLFGGYDFAGSVLGDTWTLELI